MKQVELTKNNVPAISFFNHLIRPEVADAWSVVLLIGINIGDINVISNLTYCSDKIIHETKIAHQKSGNSKVKATFVKPKRAFYKMRLIKRENSSIFVFLTQITH